jgi:hypothetical protein
MSILSRLWLKVKEISAKSGAFRGAPAHRIYVAFWDMSHAQNQRNALQLTPSLRRRNCLLLVGRSGGVAHVTPAQGIWAHIVSCCHLDAGLDGSHVRGVRSRGRVVIHWFSTQLTMGLK